MQQTEGSSKEHITREAFISRRGGKRKSLTKGLVSGKVSFLRGKGRVSRVDDFTGADHVMTDWLVKGLLSERSSDHGEVGYSVLAC